MVALDALTTLLIGLRVHETDPRLLKVHVQRLYRELDPRTPAPPPGGAERSGPSVQFAPDLHHRVAASDCLRCGAGAAGRGAGPSRGWEMAATWAVCAGDSVRLGSLCLGGGGVGMRGGVDAS